MSNSRSFLSSATLAASLLLVGDGAAQCERDWTAASGVPGANGTVRCAVEWDPDGAGPLPLRLVVGGDFTAIGRTAARGIAMRDDVTGAWLPIGTGMGPEVRALAVLPNGSLVAGGLFQLVGSTVVNNIARWDGVAWYPLANGLNDSVSVPRCNALLVMPNGDLIAGGEFEYASGTLANNIARWNGTAWSPLLVGFPGGNGEVNSLALLPNGDLVAGGRFRVAVWNGTFWTQLGTLNNFVNVVHVTASGELIAGGEFGPFGTAGSKVSRWNGTAWVPIGSGLNNSVYSVTSLANGDLVATGAFSQSGAQPAARVARWDGTAWTQLGAGFDANGRVLCVRGNGALWAGGEFVQCSSPTAVRLALWSGTAWTTTLDGFDRPIDAMALRSNGDVIVGGSFTRAGSVATARVARFDGIAWQRLADPGAAVVELATSASGDVIAALAQDGTNPPRVVRWNGTAWSQVGATFAGQVRALLELPGGALVAGGSFPATGSVAQWDGTAWTQLGAGVDGTIESLASTPNGDLVVGGTFFNAGGQPARKVARWNGTAWSGFGNGLNGDVYAVAVLPNGTVAAGGSIGVTGQPFDNVRRWDGTAWQPLGPGLNGAVHALMAMPNGDLIAGGSFTAAGATPVQRLARWNGTAWLPVRSLSDGSVRVIATDAAANIHVAGDFSLSPGEAVGHHAALPNPCAAAVGSYGAGCTGSAGPLSLATSDRPWIGTTFHATATGLPTQAIALQLYGLQALYDELWLLLPQGQPGCMLLTWPTAMYTGLPAGGSLAVAFAIPPNAGLVGAAVYQQVAVLELGAGNALQAITSTNALLLVLGTL